MVSPTVIVLSAFDVSVDVQQSLSNPCLDSKVSKGSGCCCSDTHVIKKALIYCKHGFDVILMMDCMNHHLKDEEKSARTARASIAEKKDKFGESLLRPCQVYKRRRSTAATEATAEAS